LPWIYLFVFIILFLIEYNSNIIISVSGIDLSLYKAIYSLIYLWAYFFLTLFYKSELKKLQRAIKKNIFKNEIKDFKSILNKIDLPLAFSFSFFFIVYCPFHVQHNSRSFYIVGPFAIGGAALHIITSTFLFLYEYGEKYMGLIFFKIR